MITVTVVHDMKEVTKLRASRALRALRAFPPYVPYSRALPTRFACLIFLPVKIVLGWIFSPAKTYHFPRIIKGTEINSMFLCFSFLHLFNHEVINFLI